MEESKDGATALVSPSHTTPTSSLHIYLFTSPHITPIPSPHHSLVPSASASLLKSSGSPIQIVEIGDENSSSSESTESNEVAKKTQEVEKVPSSSRLLSQDPKNPFFATTMVVTLVKKKMFSIESLGRASKVIGIESWLEDTLKRKRKEKIRVYL